MAPVTEDPRRTRRRLYRLADNHLAFWLERLPRRAPEVQLAICAREEVREQGDALAITAREIFSA
jgi:hypothetical protein